jgi:carboxyl-terminal processing protease
LITTAKAEQYYDLAEEGFEILREKLKHDNETDLSRFKPEILGLINEEIISRYYFQGGRIQLSVESDKQVEQAAKLLANGIGYSEILGI